MNDQITIKGELHLQCFNDKGELLWEDTNKNLVVTDGRAAICALLATASGGFIVDTIGFGLGSAATSVSDTDLTSKFTKALGFHSFPTASSLKYNWTLLTSEANGMSITEFGLFCSNGNMFSRLTRPAIAKTSAISLVGTWTLTF